MRTRKAASIRSSGLVEIPTVRTRYTITRWPIVIKDRKCSTRYIQRKLAIGYNKAARLVEQMEDEGLVSAANHVGKRDILVPEQQ